MRILNNILISGVALLWPERRPGVFPVSKRHDIQPGRTHLRLVVQRQVRLHRTTVRAQRAPLQVHTATETQLPWGLRGAPGGPVSHGQIPGMIRDIMKYSRASPMFFLSYLGNAFLWSFRYRPFRCFDHGSVPSLSDMIGSTVLWMQLPKTN